jgi:NADH-quinone oxidoreductase subunit I
MESYLGDVVKGTVTLIKGLFVTFAHLFHRPITLQYPEERAQMTLRFRGRLVLPIDPEKGINRCTACRRCMQTCPNHSIEVEKAVEKDERGRSKASRYLYNLATCMFCNLCVEACPYSALVMSDEYELATTDKSSLVIDLVAEHYRFEGKKSDWWRNKFGAPVTAGEVRRG